MPQILLCCVLALLLAALGLLLRSLRRRSRPSGGNETLKVLLVCFSPAAFCCTCPCTPPPTPGSTCRG